MGNNWNVAASPSIFPMTAMSRDRGDVGDLFLISVISVYQWSGLFE